MYGTSMLLREDIKYIVLDTETTGLDKKHDEITQIAIVEYNALWKEMHRFSSYVRPITTKIHDVVSMITGISIETLENAPTREDIRPSIAWFFWKNTVIIWHSIGFDIAFLERYCSATYLTTIDTLPFTQALFPYQPSYALEIITNNILDTAELQFNENHSFHDALTDVLATWLLFFTLLKKTEGLLYSFPYLREIFKRTNDGFAKCLSYKQDQQFLLKEVPILSASVTQKKVVKKDNEMALWTWYIGETSLETVIRHLPIDQNCLAFSHHPKALLAQKTYAKFGVLTALYEQTPFDSDLLWRFFTKKSFHAREAFCATKYFLHARENHSTFHVANLTDALFLQACRLPSTRNMRKKIFTHFDLFDAIENGNISRDQTITLFDKEWLFDNRRRRKHKPYDLYTFASLLDAIIYKYTLLGKNILGLEKLSSAFLIFIGFFSEESDKLYQDIHPQTQKNSSKKPATEQPKGEQNLDIPVDDFSKNTYFFRSRLIREKIHTYMRSCVSSVSPEDMSGLEKEIQKINTILTNPLILTRKRSAYQTRFTIQPVDTYVELDEFHHFFETYQVRILSALDTKLPTISLLNGDILPKDIHKNNIRKRKDISLDAGEKVCIIAPGKSAAQQLLLSLHKSKVYEWYFLAGEQVTGGAGKIIQQTVGKTSYILIWSYNFCIQCVANGIKFDSIGALDIINTEKINPFTDLWYYVANKNE